MLILKLGQQWSLVCQKTLPDISNNLVGNTADADLLDDNNYADGNIDKDAKAKSNPDKNMTGKDNNDFCKKDPVTNIEELFQYVQDQIACERLIKEVLEQTYRFFQHPINKMSLSD